MFCNEILWQNRKRIELKVVFFLCWCLSPSLTATTEEHWRRKWGEASVVGRYDWRWHAMQCKFCTLWMEKFRQATETCFTQFMFFCSHNSAVSVSSNTIYRRRVMFWIFDLRSCWISFLRRDGEHFWSGFAFLLIHFCCCRIEYERQRNVTSASAWCLLGCPTTEDANYLNTAATENDEWHLLWVDCHHTPPLIQCTHFCRT